MNTKTAKPTTTEIARTLHAATTTRDEAVALVATLTATQRTELARLYLDPADRKGRVARIREDLVDATWGDRVRMANRLAYLRAYNGDETTLACLRAVGAR
jgi:hypothetical protein